MLSTELFDRVCSSGYFCCLACVLSVSSVCLLVFCCCFLFLHPGRSFANSCIASLTGGASHPGSGASQVAQATSFQRRTFLIPMNRLSLIRGVPFHFGITYARGHAKVTSGNSSNLGNYACQCASLVLSWK